MKNTSWKWLDIASLCTKVYPSLRINKIRYFTARVNTITLGLKSTQRQDTYFRALKTITELSVHFGFFMSHPRWQPLVNPAKNGPKKAYVMYTEEKGSDVNLASYLLLDGFKNEYDVAIVISNDSDLCEPIRICRQELNLQAGVMAPISIKDRYPSRELKRVSDSNYYREIRKSALRSCQFPDKLQDNQGIFFKPKSWQ